MESPATHEHAREGVPRVSRGLAVVACAGTAGLAVAVASQLAVSPAAVATPAEPRPSVSPSLTAAMQAEMMSDILPASPPITLTDPVTDGVGALTDAERQDVVAALDRLADESDLRMLVVYIESFDGTQPVDWANASANQSGLGTEDLVLAVATADGAFGISADTNVALTDAQLEQVDEAVAAAVADERWADAATDAADTVRETGGGSSVPWLVVALVAGGVLLVAALAFVVWRFVVPRFRGRLAGVGRRPQAAGPTADELAGLTLAELDERAASALVGIDDALKTCGQELGLARAELGESATRDFEVILARATADVREAFAIRQELDADGEARADFAAGDDATTEPAPDDPDRRAALAEVLALCERAADTLDAHTRAFDDLRRLQQRAPELLDDVVTREPEVAGRVATARSVLDELAGAYPAATLALVARNPEQAELLLTNAKEAVAAGRSALDAGQKAIAVSHARGAQNALGQAITLLDAIDTTAEHLQDAAARLDKAIASLTQDVAAARAVEGDFRVTLARTAAQAALKHVEVTREGGDPLEGLQRIAVAEASLDAALAFTRDLTEVRARASALLRDILGRVEAQLAQTGDFVATRRGAIGATARTRLAEAVRLADAARALQPTDPAAALGEAQRAGVVLREAARLARGDADAVVAAAEAAPAEEGGEANGPITGGMMLGGILLDPHLVRSRRRAGTARIGGGFGGGGFGGGRPITLRRLGTLRVRR
ncbi:TPM domain-containing protein [Promicromonospora citrea]|uniref:Membrane protein n=1 Tax=Promicromonospora citrea TaxID=43677 RepID=A0A8H9GF66_9MICO|nr:TPM domain-containing protein [Promicromonospora citrea]GGM18891.1 membrane protein [Promicromonospora citrea]